jgi:hypothetical protein
VIALRRIVQGRKPRAEKEQRHIRVSELGPLRLREIVHAELRKTILNILFDARRG